MCTSASVALADEGHSDLLGAHLKGQPMMRTPSTIGTVSAVGSTTITVSTTRQGALTVDASAAEITRIPNVTIALGDIKVGDTVVVQGTLSSSTVNATRILDGVPAVPQRFSDEEGTSTDGRSPEDVREHFLGEKTGLVLSIDRSIMSLFGHRGHHGDAAEATSIAGTMAATGTDSFVLDLPARGSHASSSATIEITASTTFEKAGEPASFGDLTIGAAVRVRGDIVSTSTMTIDARTVEIGTSTPNHGVSAEAHALMAGNGASSTVRMGFKNFIHSFVSKLGHLFHF